MSDEFFRTKIGHRFYANIEALVAELREHRRRAEKNDAHDHAAAPEEHRG